MKKVLKELISRRKNIQCKIDILEKERLKFEQMIAECNCPFKVNETAVNYKGEKYKVHQIQYNLDDDFRMRGRKITKDGTLGKVSRKLYDFDKWKKVK